MGLCKLGDRRLLGTETHFDSDFNGSNLVYFHARASIQEEKTTRLSFQFPLLVIHSLNFPTFDLHISDIATSQYQTEPRPILELLFLFCH